MRGWQQTVGVPERTVQASCNVFIFFSTIFCSFSSPFPPPRYLNSVATVNKRNGRAMIQTDPLGRWNYIAFYQQRFIFKYFDIIAEVFRPCSSHVAVADYHNPVSAPLAAARTTIAQISSARYPPRGSNQGTPPRARAHTRTHTAPRARSVWHRCTS